MMSEFGEDKSQSNPSEMGDDEAKVDPLDELKLYVRKRATFKRKVTSLYTLMIWKTCTKREN